MQQFRATNNSPNLQKIQTLSNLNNSEFSNIKNPEIPYLTNCKISWRRKKTKNLQLLNSYKFLQYKKSYIISKISTMQKDSTKKLNKKNPKTHFFVVPQPFANQRSTFDCSVLTTNESRTFAYAPILYCLNCERLKG